jgi:hypothetical protein
LFSVGLEPAQLPDEDRRRDRRVLRFEPAAPEVPAERARPVIVSPAPGAGPRRWQVLASRDGWLWLAERALGGWAATLRTALLMLAGFAAAIVFVVVAFGVGGLLLGTLLGVVLYVMARVRGLTAADPPSR